MKIKYRQSGGFAGLTLGADLDVDTLPERVRERVRKLADKAKELKTPSTRGPSRGADLMTHQLTIEYDGKTHTLTFDDSNVPDSLQPLLEILQRHLKRVP